MGPIASGYTSKGFTGYIAGNPATSKRGVVMIQDIFGNHPNVYQFADVIASNGFVVAVPDMFPNNTAWPQTNWPPNYQSEEWQAFYGKISQFDSFVPKVKQAVDLLTGMGCESVGCVGLCWGVKPAICALKAKIVKAVVGPHPSFFCLDDVKDANGPICLLLSRDEAPLLDVKEELEKNQFAEKNVFLRFDELYHGFLGARGPLEKSFDFNYTADDVVTKRIAEASDAAINFLKLTL